MTKRTKNLTDAELAAGDPKNCQTLSSERLGDHGRYRLVHARTRWNTDVFFLYDAEVPDERGFATVVRQGDTREEVLAGIDPEN